MNCQHCHATLSEQARFCDQCGTPARSRPAAVHSEQEVNTLAGEAIGIIDERTGKRTGGLGVRQTFGTIEKGGSAVGAILGGEGGNVHVGGEQSYDGRRVDTAGGTYVEGGVDTGGGDFVGRDKSTVHHSAPDAGVAARAASGPGTGGDLAALFEPVYRRVEARPDPPDEDRDELREMVRRIEAEAGKGEAANPATIRRRLKSLGDLAPEIRDMTAASLAHPAAGVAPAVRGEAEAVLREGR